ERWAAWPVNWTAIWVGVLAATAALVVVGLIAIAAGAHLTTPEYRVVHWNEFPLLALIFAVAGSFLSFVLGGWVAGKVAGILRSEPAMLHGAIVWLLAVPLIFTMTALGASRFLG